MGVYHTIHTLELQRKIPLGEVSRWRGRLYELSERYGTGVYSKSKDEQEFYMYAQKGVTINLRAAVNCGFIKLTINLNSVLYAEPQRVVLFCPDKNYLGIFDRNLRGILRDAGLGGAEEFEFSRVDFSANAKVDDPLAYIALARKSGVPNGYQETYPRFDNKKQNKPIKYAYSFDLTHNREDYAVTLYSKADQLKDDRNAELRDIQDAQGLLRFEAKYGAPMLKTYIGMHDLHYSKEKLYDLLSASPSVLRRAMCSCFPEGTYYSLPAARKQLDRAAQSKQRERLLKWIEETSRMNSACKARRKLCEGLSFSQRAALMQFQRESGINPVTIGRDWKRQSLPSLQEVFELEA